MSGIRVWSADRVRSPDSRVGVKGATILEVRSRLRQGEASPSTRFGD